MIRDTGIYKIKILKEDVKNWNDDEYVFFVKTDDIESAKEIQLPSATSKYNSDNLITKGLLKSEIQNLKSQLEDMKEIVKAYNESKLTKQLEQANKVIDEIKKEIIDNWYAHITQWLKDNEKYQDEKVYSIHDYYQNLETIFKGLKSILQKYD